MCQRGGLASAPTGELTSAILKPLEHPVAVPRFVMEQEQAACADGTRE